VHGRRRLIARLRVQERKRAIEQVVADLRACFMREQGTSYALVAAYALRTARAQRSVARHHQRLGLVEVTGRILQQHLIGHVIGRHQVSSPSPPTLRCK